MKPCAFIKFCLFVVFQLFALMAFASDDRYEVSKKWFPQNFDKDYGEIASALKKGAVTMRTIPCNDDERPALKCYRAKQGPNAPEAFIAPPYLPLVPRKLTDGTFGRLGMFFQKPPEPLDATFVPPEPNL